MQVEKFLEKYFRNILWGTEKEPIFASLFLNALRVRKGTQKSGCWNID